jgi:hypothetical protein
MSCKPWNSIEESVVSLEKTRLNYQEAQKSPCSTCTTSPCCTYLPLHHFNIQSTLDVDHAVYLLNFDHIELGLSSSGEWSVAYRYPCRFLNQENFTCQIHNQPEQPQICIHYNPYRCWYKRVLTKSISDEFLRIDRQRLEYIISLLVFDETGKIVETPDWATMLEGIAQLPSEPLPQPQDPPNDDPMADMWKDLALNLSNQDTQINYSYTDNNNPCQGCQAYCCKTLVFPQATPVNRTNLDFLKFCLGFPGIELGIADDMWSIVVRTTCRHLENNRCTAYNKPERPLLCKYYDAWKCTYKPNFGTPKPAGFLRLKLEQFNWLGECFQFDEFGNITQFPSVDEIRDHVEVQWRNSSTIPPFET